MLQNLDSRYIVKYILILANLCSVGSWLVGCKHITKRK